MLAKLLEAISGKDDLERVAYKENPALLNACLKTRRVLVPMRPRRFLDAGSYTSEQLLEMVQKATEELAGDQFEMWVLDLDGKKHLPVFSSQKKMEIFQGEISKKLNKVFGLGAAEFLIEDAIKGTDIDFVDLNLYSQKSWEITVRSGA